MKIKSAAFSRVLANEIAARKRNMRHVEQRRREEVYKEIPMLKEFDADIAALAFDFGKRIMTEDNSSGIREAAERLINHRASERTELLISHGFPSNYLDKQYVCDLCHDSCRIGTELCRCVLQLAINTAFEDSGVNPDENFSAFNLDLQKNPKDRVAMSRIRDTAEQYANSFPNNEKRDLLYFGSSGVGKTYLLNCIGGRVLARGYSVLKINAHKLIQLTMDTLKLDSAEKPDFILPELLIIDDLGTEPMIPNITVETLLSIFCQRQDLNKPTAFATNLEVTSSDANVATIQTAYGERFASRLMSPKSVKIQAIRTSNVRLSQ